MKTFINKSKAILLASTLGLFFTVSVQAQQQDIEQVVASVVKQQSLHVVSQLTQQLEQSIETQLQQFRVSNDNKKEYTLMADNRADELAGLAENSTIKITDEE